MLDIQPTTNDKFETQNSYADFTDADDKVVYRVSFKSREWTQIKART